jgi:hypothetical protein
LSSRNFHQRHDGFVKSQKNNLLRWCLVFGV